MCVWLGGDSWFFGMCGNDVLLKPGWSHIQVLPMTALTLRALPQIEHTTTPHQAKFYTIVKKSIFDINTIIIYSVTVRL